MTEEDYDRALDSVEQVGTRVVLTATYKCRGTGSQVVFTEFLVEGARKTEKAQSVGVVAALCGRLDADSYTSRSEAHY